VARLRVVRLAQDQRRHHQEENARATSERIYARRARQETRRSVEQQFCGYDLRSTTAWMSTKEFRALQASIGQ
jgi:hypothetical protein